MKRNRRLILPFVAFESASTQSYCRAAKSAAVWRTAASRPWPAAMASSRDSSPARWRSSGATPSARMTGSVGSRPRALSCRTSSSAPSSSIVRSARRCAAASASRSMATTSGIVVGESSTGSRGQPLPLGQRPPGRIEHLERAHDALRVGRLPAAPPSPGRAPRARRAACAAPISRRLARASARARRRGWPEWATVPRAAP